MLSKTTTPLEYTYAFEHEPGILSRLLNQSYAKLVEAEPEVWEHEKESWKQFDREVFEYPDTVGACAFLSWRETDLVGFFSFDPQRRPALGIIGHNCILPAFQGRGFGKQQIRETLRRFGQLGIGRAEVSTGDQPFFTPARRMYIACGFREVRRTPWTRDPRRNIIRYERKLG